MSSNAMQHDSARSDRLQRAANADAAQEGTVINAGGWVDAAPEGTVNKVQMGV